MTLKEIAREAGVSISTVSRVINKKLPTAASKETQDKIWEIVRRTGYTPNILAQALKKSDSSVSSVITPRFIDCLQARTSNINTDPFFTDLERALEEEAFNHNYIVMHTYGPMDFNDKEFVNQIREKHLDGVIILGRYAFSKQQIKLLESSYKNIIYVGLNPINLECDQIICDAYKATFSAMDYLYELGHRKIGYIGEQNNECRFTAYKNFLESKGLSFSIHNTANVLQSTDGGYAGAGKLVEKNVNISAVFCANDLTAIGAIKAFHERKIYVPRNISVISMDDINLSQYINPMLTTVHIPIDELGRQTARILIDRINGGHHLPMRIELPFRIAKRDSCMKYKI